MMLRRFVGMGESPISRPWGIVIGMIDRLHHMGHVATGYTIGTMKIEEATEGLGIMELIGEDFWSRG